MCEFKDNRTEVLKPNQFSIFKAYEIHKTVKIDENTNSYYVLYFDTNWLKQFPQIEFDKNVIKDEKLAQKLLNISKNILNNKNEVEVELIDFFNQLTSLDTIIKNDVNKTNLLSEEIKEYILKNHDLNLTLDEISKKFNFSKEHIIRIFKKELGLTPHAFITSYKINHAKNIIINSKLKSISDVAQEAGFYDQSHFSKSFKKVFAINPSEVLE